MRARMINALLIVVGLLCPVQVGATAQLTGQVTHVRDGDTIEIGKIAVRLNGLTCDERGTNLGDLVGDYLRAQVLGKPAVCVLNGERSYDRLVGHCATEAVPDIAAHLIAKRLCARCARYDPIGKYEKLQRQAGQYAGVIPGYCKPRR